MNIDEMKIKDVSEETLRKYLKQLDKPILGDDLKVTHYQNGDPIPFAVSNEQWIEFGEKEIGAYCITEKDKYLYNWFAVNDDRKLAPKDWKIPTDNEWNSLEKELLKPDYAGYRHGYGHYYYMGYGGYFWSSTEVSSNNAWSRELDYDSSGVYRSFYNKKDGFSVRCIEEK